MRLGYDDGSKALSASREHLVGFRLQFAARCLTCREGEGCRSDR
jgi:hypothetical protein